MNSSKIAFAIPALVLAMATISPAWAKKDLPAVNDEGMELVKNSELATVYADPGADLSIYNRIWLQDATVAFKKNWQRDQNRSLAYRVKTSDMERITGSVKKLFAQVFTEELEKGGYTIADGQAYDVLIIRPAIIDLNVSAPDVRSSGFSQTYTHSAGSMTLYMELYDSETNALLAKVMDPRADYGSGFMQWQTGPANLAAGKRMMRPWAQALRAGLDEAREVTGQD